jgi:hypothetical protein
MDPVMMVRPRCCRAQPRIKAQRHADEDRDQHGADRQFHRRGEAVQHKLQRRFAEDEAGAQIAAQEVAEEGEVLLGQAFIEAQARDGRGAFGLCRVLADQDFDRIANRIDAGKDEDRHDCDDQHALQQSANDEDRHGPEPS